MVFFWIESPELAMERVTERVRKGGHGIPREIIYRRFYRGIKNFFELYISLCDSWAIVDNRDIFPKVIAEGKKESEKIILSDEIWKTILEQSKYER